MKIVVLNGNPKGKTRVTMQYSPYLQKGFPLHEFHIHHVSDRIRIIEKEERHFQEIIDDIRSSDAVLWAFPLSVFLVSSRYKRFIELLWKRKAIFILGVC